MDMPYKNLEKILVTFNGISGPEDKWGYFNGCNDIYLFLYEDADLTSVLSIKHDRIIKINGSGTTLEDPNA